MAAWHVLTASVVLTVVLAGLAVAVPAVPVTTDLAALLHSCRAALREHYSTPGGAAAASAGAVLALVITAGLSPAFWSACPGHGASGRLTAAACSCSPDATRLGGTDRGTPHPSHVQPPGSGHEVILTRAALRTW